MLRSGKTRPHLVPIACPLKYSQARAAATVSAPTCSWHGSSSDSWREALTVEALQRIDTLTYLLGRYPRAEATDTAVVAGKREDAPTSKTVVSKVCNGSGSGGTASTHKTPLRSKKTQLAALNARALPARSIKTPVEANKASLATPSTQESSSSPPSSRLWARQPPASSATPSVEKGPLTPVDVVERLAQEWLRKEQRVHARAAKANAAAEAAWQALLQHPPHLFADDAAVYARFGMGGYVSTSLPGFTGLFRQRWQDFHVTEMFTAVESSTAVAVSRNLDFTIPSLPSEMLQDANVARESSEADEPDLSFFAVDVKQRIQELKAEAVEDKHLAAAAEVLSRERLSSGQQDIEAVLSPPQSADGVTVSNSQTNFASVTADADGDDDAAAAGGAQRHFLQCTLHKQHIAHGNALATIAQTLRIHPRSISVAGIKDYIGDTVQRIRLEHVSPAAALAANRRFRQKRLRMTLSDFSYESGPLSPGDLFGNHFKVVLRDVDVPANLLADAITSFAEKGFPNYYGCQRFSWFAGRQDAAFALLRHNWLAFAFLFLNYTGKDRSLRELLQRPKKYPHPSQDEYRRAVVRRLRQISIEPTDLDVAPFLSCPTLNAPLTHGDGRPFGGVEELICTQLREAYFDLNVQSRRLTAQRLSSYLWNQALTLRLHHVGGEAVLDGDLVAPASVRQLAKDVDDRQDWFHTFGDRVSSENRTRYTIEDVVHPGFSFDAITLPDNIVGAYYEQICGKYALDWMAQHSRSGLRDFREPPRPIIRKPLNLSYDYDASGKVLTLRFALERGCYANVALSELMKSVRCLGSEQVTVLPLPEALWSQLGDADPGYVTTQQDIYEGYEDGVGFMNDEALVELATGSETKVWDHSGPLFRNPSEDPFRKAHVWGSQHLLRNSERRAKEAEDMKQMLFDYPLAKQMREGEVDTYAGHIVPLPPNASAKQIYAKVMQRKRRYAGSPRVVPRMQRSTSPSSHRRGGQGGQKLPSFQSLNKNSWNFTW